MNCFSLAYVLKISCCRTPKIKHPKITICKTTMNSWNFILKTQSLSFEFSLSSNFRCSYDKKFTCNMFYFDFFGILINNECENTSSSFWCKMCFSTEKYVKSSYLKKFLLIIHAFSSTLFTCIDVHQIKMFGEQCSKNTFLLPKFAFNYVPGCLQQNSNELNDKNCLWKQCEISYSVKILKSHMIRKVSNNFISKR